MIEFLRNGFKPCLRQYSHSLKRPGRGRRIFCFLIFPAVFLFLLCPKVHSTTSMEQLELAYLYKILAFVTLYESPETHITVVVIGGETFGADLQSLANKKVGGKFIVMKVYRTKEDLADCQVVFVTEDSSIVLADILLQVQQRRCLTVGDTPHFVEQGGMIGFITEQGKLYFEVNQKVAVQNGIRLNSNLLEVASRVIR